MKPLFHRFNLIGIIALLAASPLTFADDAATAARVAEAVSEFPDRDLREPLYTYFYPTWAFEAAGSWRALGKSALNPTGTNQALDTKAITLSFQFSPPWTQKFGVISLGPSLGLFPVAPESGLTRRAIDLWEVGGQVQYQARYFHEQILVPVVGYDFEYLSYNFLSGASNQTLLSGPYFGAYLFLNFFEPNVAAEMFANHQVVRSYLIAEIRSLQGTSPDFSISGPSYYFGLRLEY